MFTLLFDSKQPNQKGLQTILFLNWAFTSVGLAPLFVWANEPLSKQEWLSEVKWVNLATAFVATEIK